MYECWVTCFSFRCSWQNEIVIDGYNGLLFNLNENQDYYKKLKIMIGNTKLYSSLSKGAIATAKKYSSNKMVHDYYNLMSGT